LLPAVLAAVLAAACTTASPHTRSVVAATPSPSGRPTGSHLTLNRIPALLDPRDIYAADRPGLLSAEAAKAVPLVYVPDDDDATVHVIDPVTFRVVRVVQVGRLPQHVTPSWDLRTLWVDNDMGNSLTPIDPRTGRLGKRVPVEDPYNLYFTADGQHAVVVAERLRRLDFRDPHTMALQHSLHVPCAGVDHADFSADGTHALFSCEFGGQMAWIDMVHQKVLRTLDLPRQNSRRPKPQDVKTSPDGKVFYVADENSDGVYLIDAHTLKVIRFLPTGRGAHGLYVSRDSKDLYITNRRGGSVSVLHVPPVKCPRRSSG